MKALESKEIPAIGSVIEDLDIRNTIRPQEGTFAKVGHKTANIMVS
jgi:hypothetical protein